MAHDHAHGSIANTGAEHQKRLMMSLGLTSTVFIAEVISAVITESLALLVDAGHMLTDMSVLIASTVTAILMQRKPSNKRTWGWARLEVLTAAVGALILLIVGIYALVEAGMRLFGGSADEVNDVRLLLFMGILGLAANIGSIFILASQSEDNMNMKAAFLEVMNDALGSVAVIVSASVLICTGWAGFDAVAGGIIALMMIPRAIKLLRNAVRVLLEETPNGLDLDEVRSHLEQVPACCGGTRHPREHRIHRHADLHGACCGRTRTHHERSGGNTRTTTRLPARTFPRIRTSYHLPTRTGRIQFDKQIRNAFLNILK